MHRIHHTLRRIVDADLPKIRDAETGELRQATDDELLNAGLVPVGAGIYSCVEQVRRDPETEEWSSFGHAPVGELLAHGEQRFSQLPDAVKADVLHADVIRAADPEGNAVLITMSAIAEQTEAIEQYVGLVDDAPLVDLTTDAAIASEAQRLASIPDSGVVRASIPMADVDEDVQVVAAANLPPHSWAGEPRPRRTR